MADNPQAQSPEEHIGSAPHPKRNLLMGVGAVAAAGLIGLFYWQAGKSDDAAIAELTGFRQAMAVQCKQEAFAKPVPAGLNSLYADSSRMQTVLQEQFSSLRRGQANCDQIVKALKSVDFPVD